MLQPSPKEPFACKGLLPGFCLLLLIVIEGPYQKLPFNRCMIKIHSGYQPLTEHLQIVQADRVANAIS